MPFFHRKYYYNMDPPVSEQMLLQGIQIIENHPLYGRLKGEIYMKSRHLSGKGSMAAVDRKGNIYLNCTAKASPEEWAYCIAHCLLHLAFGHFDRSSLPEEGNIHLDVWAKACDIYVACFLSDTDFGEPVVPDPKQNYSFRLTDEKKIYHHLIDDGDTGADQEYSLNGKTTDMIGLEHPLEYGPGETNPYTAAFAYHLSKAARSAVHSVSSEGTDTEKQTLPREAAQWFLSHYPLLGGLASGFRLIEDDAVCRKEEIQIAAVDASAGEIYLNPSAGLSLEEWKFVLAHEYLHAGLDHAGRCQGRDRYLWNIACDYVINDWLMEMHIGKMPDVGLLYDEALHGMSAEAVYDLIMERMRRLRKHATFRGYGKGDIIPGWSSGFQDAGKAIGLDDFLRMPCVKAWILLPKTKED